MGKLILWVLMGICSLVSFGVAIATKDKRDRYDARPAFWTALGIGTGLTVLTVVWIVFSVFVVVPPTSAAVIKNTMSGTMRYAGSGWQMLNPIIEQAEIYDLRVREFQIGEPNEKDQEGNVTRVLAVEADSDSPGRPVVYLNVTARVGYSTRGCPGSECDLVEIERKYGKAGWESLVKDRMEMTARQVAGENPYSFVGSQREAFAEVVYGVLQEELDGLATMEFVGIPWYDFSKKINDGLDAVAAQERQNEQKAQEVERERLETERVLEVKAREVQEATQNAERARIEKEGLRVASKIDAEAAADVAKIQVDMEAYQVETRAQATAKETLVKAEAQAEANLLIAKAQADGFRAQLSAFSGDVDGFVAWTQASRWQGGVPQTMMGQTAIPFLEIGE